MNYKRSSGILLHPTSLPGPDGIGDLGPEAYHWVNFLEEAGLGLWQVLPLGPTGYGDSPYQCFSAFAGNPYLVSPAMLLEDGLLTRSDLSDRPQFPAGQVDYGPVIAWKLKILDRAFRRFVKTEPAEISQKFQDFQSQQAFWLDDYTLFISIKQANGGVSWSEWPEPLRNRDPRAIEAFRQEYAENIHSIAFSQYLFFKQWNALHQYANKKNILIIGDIPIFVSYDSSDAWSHRELFYIDPHGKPTVVAGVPPDYFSPTGQLWGNPLYRWETHKATGYQWWIERMRATLNMVDIIRLDHFRGFAGYWEVPADKPTAEIGRWVKGPGSDIFRAFENSLGDLPIIAEDLGEITQDVVDLVEEFKLPGMKVFQFAFLTDFHDPFLPHNFNHHCVAYTGTHDNDTTLGWYESAPDREKDLCRRYLARSGADISWDAIRAIWSSISVFALAPMQDLLSLGSKARMNFPGKASGNWTWRLPAGAITTELTRRMAEMNKMYTRQAKETEPAFQRKKIDYVEATG